MPADNEQGGGGGGNIHPGSWIGDSVEEFKKLPTWGKFAILAVFVVAGYLFYRWKTNAASATTSSTVGAASTGVGLPAGATDPTTGTTTDMSGTSSNNPSPTPPTQGGGNPPPGAPVTPPTHTGGPAPTPRPHPPAPTLKTYTVVHGDTLSGIAARLHYQGGWQALYAKNQGVIGGNPNLILPGQKLTL